MESHGTLAFAILDAVQGHPNIAQLSFHKLIFPTQYLSTRRRSRSFVIFSQIYASKNEFTFNDAVSK